MDFKNAMRDYIDREIAVMEKLNLEELNDALNAIIECREHDGTIFTMGNGGSASTASHFVCDFTKGLSEEIGGRKFCFQCLSDNTATMTAIANDFSYDEIFIYQLRERLKPGDLVIAISGSGNSKNIIRAVEYAKKMNVPVIGISGYRGGKLKELADYHMHADIEDMQIVEDVHLMFDHMFMRVAGMAMKTENKE